MDSEPFLVTPEKGSNTGGVAGGLVALKRGLFEEASWRSKPSKEQESYEAKSNSLNMLPSPRDFSFASPPAKGSKKHLKEDSTPRSLVQQHSTFESKTDEESSGAKRRVTEGTLPASEAANTKETAYCTPLKAKRPDEDIFTPPAARTNRPLSFASSPLTPLHALGHRNSTKKSGRLKELSMQLEEAHEVSEATGSLEASASNLREQAEASTSVPDCEPSSPHPYAMLAAAQPAKEYMADPKYRGMAALGCQHQYTEADRNKFLRRRKHIERMTAGMAEIA